MENEFLDLAKLYYASSIDSLAKQGIVVDETFEDLSAEEKEAICDGVEAVIDKYIEESF